MCFIRKRKSSIAPEIKFYNDYIVINSRKKLLNSSSKIIKKAIGKSSRTLYPENPFETMPSVDVYDDSGIVIRTDFTKDIICGIDFHYYGYTNMTLLPTAGFKGKLQILDIEIPITSGIEYLCERFGKVISNKYDNAIHLYSERLIIIMHFNENNQIFSIRIEIKSNYLNEK